LYPAGPSTNSLSLYHPDNRRTTHDSNALHKITPVIPEFQKERKNATNTKMQRNFIQMTKATGCKDGEDSKEYMILKTLNLAWTSMSFPLG
jgi:hypothetical protein